LLQKKDELINKRNTQPFYLNADLEKLDLLSLGTSFDVILIDPPLEEYVPPFEPLLNAFSLLRYYLRALENVSTTDHVVRNEGGKRPFWTESDLEKLDIPGIAASPCFLFLWTGDGGEGLEVGRRLFKKWGFRRSEDIVWVKTNKENVCILGIQFVL
jgi:mRNA (2'-O-methyladenosine-N6-)-methyltransferase